MFFAWDITIPAGTPETDPVIKILKLTKGVITRVDLKFPRGCHGMVRVRLTRYESPLVPLSRGEWVTGDNESIPTEGYYELTEIPTQLKFVGCSPGTLYDHTVTVRIQVLPQKVATMIPVIELLSRLLQRMGVIV
jgi:hypothetical protein